jgi:hypothetical protein
MRKRTLLIAILCGGLLLAAGVLLAMYCAAEHVPAFYRQAMATEQPANEKGSSEMLQQATAFASDVRKEGHWQAVFTAAQINGWLAVDFVQNYRGTLPDSFRDPRATIEADRMVLACRVTWGPLSSVVTVAIEPYLAEPGVLALRLRNARAGLLPLPLRKLVDEISAVARHAKLNLRWRQSHGDPVALISFADPADAQSNHLRIESLQLADGEIYVAGTTQ